MEVTLGGDRLGSGNKNKLHLRNYERSTHNLSTRFTSTMGVGMCVPCLIIPTLRGDVFDIKINAACRTLPTRSPLFSTFKMQVDIFESPVRLYQAILHNNPLFIGLKMKDVKFPLLELQCIKGDTDFANGKCADNSLMKYLGLSGMGAFTALSTDTCKRYINAIPMLAYFDICKTYYSNKQEEDAYVMSTTKILVEPSFGVDEISDNDDGIYPFNQDNNHDYSEQFNTTPKINSSTQKIIPDPDSGWPLTIDYTGTFNKDKVYATAYDGYGDVLLSGSLHILEDFNLIDITTFTNNFTIDKRGSTQQIQIYWSYIEKSEYKDSLALTSFKLENIDKMRLNILSNHTLGTPFIIDSTYSDKPYKTFAEKDADGKTKNAYDLQGLFIKTYQADLFNAWVNTEWITGENGIAEMTKIAVSDGAIYMDAMLLAEKTYNMLNRIAVAGGTYEDWQNVVYTETNRKHIESPIYCGGLSNEIVFEEIIQTTPTENAPLGTLGGRGIAVKRKGGNVSIKCDEAGYLMGIVSITPRIYFTQGNEFYLTELQSMDDMHKPALDGIGFQNLLAERLLWSASKFTKDGVANGRPIVGKVPAWIEYMTNIDRAYGEFCDIKKAGTMILGRRYVQDTNTGALKDATTYIDPAKFNYAFGDANLLAQNFWVQIDFDIKARRLMSAKQIPNL